MGGQGTSFSPGDRRRCVPGGLCSHPGRVLLHGGGTRSIVGAPPRCEAKANQYTEPALFAPGADAPTWWGGAFDCRSTASVRSEGKPIHRACPVRTRGGCSYGCCAEMKKPPHLSMRGLLIWRSGRDSNPRPPA